MKIGKRLGDYTADELIGKHFRAKDPFMEYEVTYYFPNDNSVAILTIGNPNNIFENDDDKVYVESIKGLEKDIEMSPESVHASLCPPGP